MEELVWLAALREFTGAARGVVYDVPRGARPVSETGRLRPRGSLAWDRFLDAREQMDSGELTLTIALRQLDDDEARLVVDWGCTYANTFLLIEPADPGCDLTDPDNEWSRELAATALAAARSDRPQSASHPAGNAALAALLRRAFGTWVFWTAPPPHGTVQRVRLDLSESAETLADHLLHRCYERFRQEAYDHEVVRLQLLERELVAGPVPRVRSVFRTRLGMPVLVDPFAPDRSVRGLVNRGRLSVADPRSHNRVVYGPRRPVPPSLSNEQFAQLHVV